MTLVALHFQGAPSLRLSHPHTALVPKASRHEITVPSHNHMENRSRHDLLFNDSVPGFS
jgi:hypothetical protein